MTSTPQPRTANVAPPAAIAPSCAAASIPSAPPDTMANPLSASAEASRATVAQAALVAARAPTMAIEASTTGSPGRRPSTHSPAHAGFTSRRRTGKFQASAETKLAPRSAPGPGVIPAVVVRSCGELWADGPGMGAGGDNPGRPPGQATA